MRIVVDVNHPHQVHLFKNFIWEMEKRGHDVLITASKKEISIELLERYGFNYVFLGSYGSTVSEKLLNLVKLDFKMYKAVREFNPDLFLGMSSVRAAHIAKLMNKASVTFADTEPGIIQNRILFCPFTDVILTPNCYKKDYGKKHLRYNGYQELAYLHPKYFKPNPTVLNEIGLSKDEPFVVLRFVGWASPHEIGMKSSIDKNEFVNQLEKYGKILISSEAKLSKDLEKYKFNISPDKMHDVLYYASLYLGEGATMATESAILGTPSIFISSLAGTIGNLAELENNYGLAFSYDDPKRALDKSIEIMQRKEFKCEWKKQSSKLISDKIDVTEFMIWFIENYPVSFRNTKEYFLHGYPM